MSSDRGEEFFRGDFFDNRERVLRVCALPVKQKVFCESNLRRIIIGRLSCFGVLSDSIVNYFFIVYFCKLISLNGIRSEYRKYYLYSPTCLFK